MKPIRHYGVKILVVVMLLGLLTSVGSAKQVELTFWKHAAGSMDDLMIKLIEQFERENPDIKINFVTLDDLSYRTKSLITFAAKGGPDVFLVQSQNRATFISKDIAAPIHLEGFGVGSVEDAKALYEPGIAEQLMVDGEFRIVPFEWSSTALYVNTEHFRESGLDHVNEMPGTWEQVTEVGKKLARYDGSGRITRDGMLIPVGSRASAGRTVGYHFDGHYVQLGGNYIDPTTGKSTVNDSAASAALQWEVDLVNKHSVTNGPNDVAEFMANGQASMGVAGMWFIPYMEIIAPDLRPFFQTALYPQAENHVQQYINGGENWSLGVSNGSGHQKEAWKFVRFITDNSNQLLSVGHVLPVNRWFEKEGATELPDHLIWAESMPISGRARSPLEAAFAAEINSSLKRAIDDAVLNKVPVKVALDKAKEEIDAAISR